MTSCETFRPSSRLTAPEIWRAQGQVRVAEEVPLPHQPVDRFEDACIRLGRGVRFGADGGRAVVDRVGRHAAADDGHRIGKDRQHDEIAERHDRFGVRAPIEVEIRGDEEVDDGGGDEERAGSKRCLLRARRIAQPGRFEAVRPGAGKPQQGGAVTEIEKGEHEIDGRAPDRPEG